MSETQSAGAPLSCPLLLMDINNIFTLLPSLFMFHRDASWIASAAHVFAN